MVSGMRCFQLENSEVIQQLRDEYLRTLVVPMDGMWESTVIAHASFWQIQDRGQYAGYFCLDSNNYLLRFHLLENYLNRAQEIFRWIISTYDMRQASTSTIEPLYFSLCLDVQTSVTVQSYFFRDNCRVELSSGLSNSIFRKAEERDADLGVVVAQPYRNKGLGSFTLSQLKHHCYNAGWKPICSCTATNHASKKAIEKAGFICEQRMVKMQIASDICH